jgi:hypothetical protein
MLKMDSIKLPNSWEEVYADQFLELKKLDESNSSFFVRQIEILSILNDTLPDDEMWEDLDVEELAILIGKLKWLRYEPSTQLKTKIGDYTCININKLSFGEFIDLEYYFSNNYYENLSNICSVLYRKTKCDEWSNLIYEPYESINIEDRCKAFDELPITDIYGVIKYYLDFKELLMTTYEKLFEPQFDDDEEIDESQYDQEEKDDIEKEKVIIKWSWENIIHKLTDGDVTKYEKITSLPVIFIFNQLSYLKDINQ